MRGRRLEKILEECLAAYLEGRRSIEESLSLYPSLADRLEPLLRTAANVADTFEPVPPPQRAMEEGRRRFLARAAGRRLLQSVRPARANAGWRRWALAGGAGVIAAASVLGVAALTGRGDEGGPAIVFRAATPAPAQEAVVRSLQTRIDVLTAQASGGATIETQDLWNLTRLAARIGDPSLLDENSRRQMEEGLQALVGSVTESSRGPSGVADAVAGLSEEMARLGVDVDGPSVSQSPAPGGTPTPVVSPSPSAPAFSPAGSPTPRETSGAGN